MQNASTGPHSGSTTDDRTGPRRTGRAVSREELADHVYAELLASLLDRTAGWRPAPSSALTGRPATWTFLPLRSARPLLGLSTPEWSGGWL